MGQQVNQNKIISPCVGVCEIDVQSQLCIGCLRSTDEIAMWPQIDYEKSLELINQIAKRSISKN
ncbi:DUF1289 domain-containing protein [Alphaproteobacteria bacterium]|jgi:predicted Fe-S protein YdhL (DUF1289 family)|nr:DUF1289 domain-containing protein [Alphaproteobacteria bacterium]MDC1086610.1 DUF1289 domain-containing protein [Alphaproteobacteria bacterium]